MKNLDLKSTRQGFGDALLKIAKENKDVYALCADLSESLSLGEFSKQFPENYIECGVAEQNMIGIAAGLASENKIPFASSFAVFSPGRTWDQIRVSVCISNLPVKIVGGHGGLSNFKDGASHQAYEDVAISRVLPNLKVVVPCDYNQTIHLIEKTILDPSPTYIRLSSEKIEDITEKNQKYEIGVAQKLTKGNDLIIISCGPIINRILKALDKTNIKATVINMHTIKPLDTEIIDEALEVCRNIITVEDHQIIGGLGSAIAEYLSEQNKKVKFKRIGICDTFGLSARSIEDLYKHFKLDENSLAKQFEEFLDS